MSGVSSIRTGRGVGSNPAFTVAHIAPERYSIRPYFDVDDGGLIHVSDLARKSDIYSYGVVLWEIREKVRPYKGFII